MIYGSEKKLFSSFTLKLVKCKKYINVQWR